MGINKHNVTTQDELKEPAPIDQVEPRVEGKMKKIEGNAKQAVADGLGDPELAREADQLKRDGAKQIREAKDQSG